MSKLANHLNKYEFDEVLSALDIETLDKRNSDSYDFFETSVWAVDYALTYVYLLGRKHALTQAESGGVSG